MPEVILGLDIGSRNIKAALVKQGKKPQIIGATVIRTPDGSVSDGAIKFMDAITDSVREYIGNSGAKPSGLAISINSPEIITRSLTLPVLTPAEIPPAVKFEIFKFFPSIKESHEITQTVLSYGESSVSALAAICPQEMIRAYQELAARLGLRLKRVGIRADAQAKAVAYFCGANDGPGTVSGSSHGGSPGAGADEKKAFASDDEAAAGGVNTGLLVDIGYRNSLVSVIDRGKLVLSRYTMSGAVAYDNMLAEKAGVTRDDIENARLGGDFSTIKIDRDDAENILNLSFMDISDQLRQILEIYSGDPSNEKPSYIAVTGEGGMIPDIERYLGGPHGLRQRALTSAGGKTGYDSLQLNPKLLLAAAGSALGGSGAAEYELNFAPGPVGAGERKGAGSRRLAVAVTAALLIAVSSIAAGLYFIADRNRSNAEITDIYNEINQDLQAAVQNAKIDAAQSQLSTLASVLGAIDANSAKASGLLEDITAQLPEGLFITGFNMPDAYNLIMNGRSRDYEGVSDFALLLRRTGSFDSVRINSITANQTASELISDYGFSMTIIVKGN